MPKNIDDIVVPSGRKSIRNIPIPENRRQSNAAESAFRAKMNSSLPEDAAPRFKPPFRQQSKPKFSKKFIWSGIVIVVIILAVTIFSLFSGATVTYIPKSAPLSFSQDSYTAYKSGDSVLLFSVIKLSEDKGANAPASGTETASVKANGTIIVYNNNKNSQKLVATTRFETTDGKVYRIPTAITVPGQTTVNGSVVPGSIETTVSADQPGADYNIDLSDFTVPGFKGDPRFTTIYARSKTPMTGGFVGTRKKVSDTDLATTNASLQATLKTDLMNQAKAQAPSDFIIYPNLVYISYTDLPQTSPSSNGVTVNEHADLYGVMFKKADLANFLASKKLTDPSLTSVQIPDLANLDLSFVGQSGSDLLNANQLNFQVAGTATAVALTDESALQKDLAGKSKSDLSTVLQNSYPGILSASAVIRPFWKSSFPTEATKIKIVENIPK